MKKPYARLFIIVLLAFGVGACESDVRVQKLPELTFTHLDTIKLDAARLETVSRYKAPMKKPNVEHLLPAQPENALENWARDRLQTAGRSGTARFIVHEASVVEEKLEMDTGFTGAFKKQQSERYTARVEATLEIVDASGKRRGYASANALRSRTIREDATLNEREKMWYALVEDLMKTFDKEMTENVKRHLVNWVM